jgi:hypothetical protein
MALRIGERWWGEGCAQQITAYNNTYSSFSAFLLAPFPVFLSAVYPAGLIKNLHMKRRTDNNVIKYYSLK